MFMKKIFFIFFILSVLSLSGCSNRNIDPCMQKLVTEGTCEKLITGYEYDRDSGICSQVTGSGCTETSPFNSMDACRLACEKEYTSESWKDIIPASCKHFNDGCNTCSRVKGEDIAACTKMACVKYQRPICTD
jgi:hypothetical protein